ASATASEPPSSPTPQVHPFCAPCTSTIESNCFRPVRLRPPSAPRWSEWLPPRRRPLSMAEVVIVDNPDVAGDLVAEEIMRLIAGRPDAVLGLATGSTPLPVYEALRARASGMDLSQLRGFALDEYVGIDPGHPESYRSVITREVVEPLGLNPDNVHVPNG